MVQALAMSVADVLRAAVCAHFGDPMDAIDRHVKHYWGKRFQRAVAP